MTNAAYLTEYCRSYFELLYHAARFEATECENMNWIHRVAGFETAPIHYCENRHPDLMVIDTKTNPVYLLSRICQPNSWDNLRFLPLVIGHSSNASCDRDIFLYHQYRQISGGTARPTTLFTYIPVDHENRRNSFIAWQKLAACLTYKKGTLTKMRAKCLSERVVFPLIDKIPGMKQSSRKILRIADLGGGSGDLAKEIFENLFFSHPELSDLLQISLTVVDYDFPDMTRHLKNTKFYRSLAALKCKRMSFLDWIREKTLGRPKREVEIAAETSEQISKPFDLIFMFRLLNNMSEFDIEKTGDWQKIRTITCEKISKSDWDENVFYPHFAIQSGAVEKIVLSTRRVSLDSGATWCLSSLTDYFRVLYRLSKVEKDNLSTEKRENEIFYPVRKLDLNAIPYGPGRNLFADLCRLCHFVVIEDIDLKLPDLRDHLLRHGHPEIKVVKIPSRIPSSNTMCVFEEPIDW